MSHAVNGTATSWDSGRSYELIGELGRGGFGAVFKARLQADAGFTKMVAIKMLHDEGSARPEFANRLRDEARLLARLRHRAIVAVHDLVRLEGRWAVVMEYVEGADLLSLIRLGPMPPRTALEIGVEVASALHVIHSATDPDTGRSLGIVHRDLKPSNVRVTPHGEVKLLDFGIARAAFPGREAVTGSVRFESAGYVAPERLYGMDTPAADVFSLGVVLYEMLAGDRLGPLPDRKIPYEKARDRAFADLIARRDDARIEPIIALAAAMMAFEDRDRPTAEQAADRMRDLLQSAQGEWLARWAPEAVRSVAGEQDLPSVSAEPVSTPSLESASPVSASTIGAPPPAGRHASQRTPTAAPTRPPPPIGAALPKGERMALAAAGVLLLLGLIGTIIAVGADPEGEVILAASEPAEASPTAPPALAVAEPAAAPSEATLEAPAAPPPTAEARPAEPQPTAPPQAAQESTTPAPTETTTSAAPPTAAPPTAAPPTAAPVSTAASAGATTGSGGGRRATPRAPKAGPSTTDAQPAPVEEAPAAPSLATLIVSGDYYKAEWIDQRGMAHAPGAVSPGNYYLRVRFAESLSWVETKISVSVAAGDTKRVRCSYEAEACRIAP